MSTSNQPPRLPFTRLAVPNATPDVFAAVNDIYDKLALISERTNPIPGVGVGTTAKTVSPSDVAALVAQAQQIADTATNAAISTCLQKSGAGSGGSDAGSIIGSILGGLLGFPFDLIGAVFSIFGITQSNQQNQQPQYAMIPSLSTLPSANPNAKPTYAQDGLLIEIANTTKDRGTLYRYDCKSMSWAGPILGTLLTDSHANRANYAAAEYTDVIFFESDRKYLYYSDGTNWLFIGGESLGTYEARWGDLGANDKGALYVETSRSTIASSNPFPAFRWDGSEWVLYAGGPFQRTQSQLTTLAATLTTNDSGVVVNVTDFDHLLRWTGSAWTYAVSGDRAAYVSPFFVAPSPSTGWHLCDGTANVTYLKADGTTGTQTLPDLVSATSNAAYLKYGSPVTGVNAAIAPTFTGGAYTPAGTITMDAFTPAGTNSSPSFTGTPLATHQHEIPISFEPLASPPEMLALASYGTGTTKSVQFQEAGTTVAGSAAAELTQAVSAGTPAGSVSAPTFTGTPAAPTGTFTGTPGSITGTISATGQPQNIVLLPYFRR